ncbi:MAG: transglutaminase domain-containing protein [Bacteroidota bacterium]
MQERAYPWWLLILPVFLIGSSWSYAQNGDTDLAQLARSLTEGLEGDSAKAYALYDWVTTHIAYDTHYQAIPTGFRRFRQPHQLPLEVLARQEAVCEGYANLLVALGEAAGLQIVRIEGIGRAPSGPKEGVAHAWNAVKIDHLWYLMDATWGAGYVSGRRFQFDQDLAYFMARPGWFLRSHWPNDPMWQLMIEPIRYQDFLAQQPASAPEYFSYTDTLVAWEALPLAEQRLSQWERQWRWDQTNVYAKFRLAYYTSQLGMHKLARYNAWKARADEGTEPLPDKSVVLALLAQAETYFSISLAHYQVLEALQDPTFGDAVRNNAGNLRENAQYFPIERDGEIGFCLG